MSRVYLLHLSDRAIVAWSAGGTTDTGTAPHCVHVAARAGLASVSFVCSPGGGALPLPIPSHSIYDWIADQLENFAQQEWLVFNASQREAIESHPDVPWCVECEDWTESYAGSYRAGQWELNCSACDKRLLPERPMIHGFTWKTAFYRGALLRISNRLYEQRLVQKGDGLVTALVVRTDQENAAYINQHFGELRKGRPRRAGYHAGAYERGKDRGGDVSLAPKSRLKGGDASA